MLHGVTADERVAGTSEADITRAHVLLDSDSEK
jgi:hypothetical protein